ncbi:MAG: L-histidine N(alpha)-methyltransferase [Gammaproteobacteria bacterium]|nr:L-histidine N(alpha)-methyltransferase [Gammaproteobacteria bacterium]
MSQKTVHFHDMHPTVENLLEDVLVGLRESPRSISPKYFYNDIGSQLFDQITETEDYYPTRTEISILQKYKQDIVQSLNKDCLLIEPGGGSCSKVRIFVDDLRPSMYVPMDISKEHLLASATQMSKEIPWLEIHAVCNDFTCKLTLPEGLSDAARVVFFPGSSIGNFSPDAAIQYLSEVKDLLGIGGQLLIGVDLKKDKNILENAYDDSEGITAQFNLNLLTRLNNELYADFDLQTWEHYSFYNADQGRIEMHLRSMCKQVVNISDHEFYFSENETIHTENSHKYSIEEFQSLASKAGFSAENVWLDDNELFSVQLYSVKI